ncbi:hypothetical protein SAMN05444157_3209 [Frankineae bacterium MT45]|nr:hypothetical protein SAMN05444157_3209 [Frankineae bacterium MT45]
MNKLAAPMWGLYYPYVHLRDESWLKLALLYWPKMARLVTPGYPVADPEGLRAAAGELGWLVDVEPGASMARVAPTFEQLLDIIRLTGHRLGAEYHPLEPPVDWFLPPRWGEVSDVRTWRSGLSASGSVGLMPAAEFAPVLLERLLECGAAARYDTHPEIPGGWVVVQRDLAWAYKCLLSEDVASHNALSLVTDQSEACAATSGLTAEDLVLGGIAQDRMNFGAGQAEQSFEPAVFGLLSLRMALPADLDRVPIAEVIAIRKRHGEQFLAWRQAVDVLADTVASTVATMESPELMTRYLTDQAHEYTETTLRDARRDLRDIGMDVAEGVMNLKVQTPSLLAGVSVFEHSVVGAAAGAALGLAEVYRGMRKKQQARDNSNHSYLWSVRADTNPTGNVSALRRQLRSAVGL